jgi:sulfite oxidase
VIIDIACFTLYAPLRNRNAPFIKPSNRFFDNISIYFRKTWFQADLEQLAQPYMRAWAWTLWTYHIPLNELPNKPFDIVCRAMDIHSNTQPDTPLGIWNIRGVMNNAWHKITLQIDEEFLKKR